MELKAGTVNAIVGPSGSGKSTIAKLIASLWDVDSGNIKIGGVDVKELAQFVKISDREIQTLRMTRWLRLQRRAAVMNLSCS